MLNSRSHSNSAARYVARYLKLAGRPECDLTGPPDRTTPHVLDYGAIIEANDFVRIEAKETIPTVVSNWDNTPRYGGRGFVFENSTPELFARHLQSAWAFVQ